MENSKQKFMKIELTEEEINFILDFCKKSKILLENSIRHDQLAEAQKPLEKVILLINKLTEN